MCLWPGLVVLKAVAGGQIVGVAAGDPRRDATLIVTLGVDPDWRRRGLGERLMRACEGRFDLSRYRLQVRQSNAPAIRLYQKLGYTIVDRLPGYYADGEGAFLMEKERG